MINGNTDLIAHIGWPTHTFKSPMIYNPYFEQAGINAVVVPMGWEPTRHRCLSPSCMPLWNKKPSTARKTPWPPSTVPSCTKCRKTWL